MSDLDHRFDAPRYPTPRRETVMEIAATVFLLGILTGIALSGAGLSVAVAFGGGQVCFSRDGISCIKEGSRP